MLRHRVLVDEAAIAARVGELAEDIRRDRPHLPLAIVGLLTGSFVFVADLARMLTRLGAEVEVDFIRVSHYAATTDPSRPVEMSREPLLRLAGKAVLLVDDIVDSGVSLLAVREYVERQRPAWLRTCAMLDKPERRTVPFDLDYRGFVVPDRWLIGYGLDLAGEGRGLPYVAVVEMEPAGAA